MIGHQRAVLAQLGIDIWVSRQTTVCQQVAPATIWRDQAHSEMVADAIPAPFTVTRPAQTDLSTVSAPPRLDLEKFHFAQADLAQKTQTGIIEQQAKVNISAFSLQALQLTHMVIVLNSTVMSAQQQQLWSNIQRTVNAAFFELHWPFTLPEMNDVAGVENYIQGFIDMISHEKLIISLGEIPYWKETKIMQLSSLQEMLDRPLLKRRLWNFIQNKQNVAG